MSAVRLMTRCRVQADGGEQEDVADRLARQPHLLGDCEQNHEQDESAGVEGVVLLQLLAECLLGGGSHGL